MVTGSTHFNLSTQKRMDSFLNEHGNSPKNSMPVYQNYMQQLCG